MLVWFLCRLIYGAVWAKQAEYLLACVPAGFLAYMHEVWNHYSILKVYIGKVVLFSGAKGSFLNYNLNRQPVE